MFFGGRGPGGPLSPPKASQPGPCGPKKVRETMPKHLEVYKCVHCGNIVEVLHGGGADIVCCGEPMKLMKEGATDGALEKHVPVIEKVDGGYKVKVGSVPHPMEEKHWIEWIELLADGRSYTKFLNPGDAPEAFFAIDAAKVTAREFCNLHGHWKAEN
jgi:superoxide reductase